MSKLLRWTGLFLFQPPSDRATSSSGDDIVLQVDRWCVGLTHSFGECLVETREKTLFRLLANALLKERIGFRTEHRTVEVGKLLDMLEQVDEICWCFMGMWFRSPFLVFKQCIHLVHILFQQVVFIQVMTIKRRAVHHCTLRNVAHREGCKSLLYSKFDKGLLDQLTSILPILAANRQIPTVLFMLNNPAGMLRFEMLEPHRVVLGFPSVAGTRQGDAIRYSIAPQVLSMMLGEEDGRVTPRIRQLATVFKRAGFSVGLSPDMQTWLKTHAIMGVCIIAAVVMTKGTSAQLGRTREHVVMMVQAIHEGLLALQAQDIPVTPFSMKVLFFWMPRWFAVILWQYILRTPIAALGIDPHLDTALGEMHQVARDIMAQLQKSPLSTPTLSHLITFLEIPA